MFKFKGISSKDMQVIIEEEEHFIARAARRYETIEIEGRDGAIFNELGYAYVERPIYVQCLNPDKIDEILSWLDGEGEFEYKGRKTTARFYSELEPKREGYIKIIDTTFIRDPFWTKLDDEFVEIKGKKEKTQESENINIKGTIPTKFKEFKLSGNSKQETRSGKNLLYVPDQTVELNGFKVTVKDGKYTVEDNRETGIFVAIVLATNFTLKAGTYTISNGRNQNYPYVNLRSNGSAVGDSTMGGGDNGVKTITIAEDIVVDTIAIYAGTNAKITEIFPQLEEGTQATDYEPYGAMPSPEYPSEIQNVEGDVNVTVANKEKTEQQTVTFPLAQGQKLMLGDYLASDGIHHKRKQIELDGTDFSLYSNQVAGRTIYMISAFSNNNNFKTYDSSILCNILKQGTSSNENNYLNNNGSSGSLYVSIENSILGITDESTNEEKLEAFQNLIAETGFVYKGELAEEETEAYTEEQQEAYNQLINLKAYEEETNVYSTNSTSPIFKVTYLEETTEKIVNEGNIYSRPILRLEKTSYNNVDLEIAGTRFQYDFNNEEYVEIDCEEKTALYEGLNRNRKMTIGYEFPKLIPGSNDIKMYEGDCILKAKRKDRWL